MYTPKFNQLADRALLIETMRTHSFAILLDRKQPPELRPRPRICLWW